MVRLHRVGVVHSINLRHKVIDELSFVLMLLNLETKIQVSVDVLLRDELLPLFAQSPLFHGIMELITEARGSEHRVEHF